MTAQPKGDRLAGRPLPEPAIGDEGDLAGSAYRVAVRVDKYRPGRRPAGPPDEVVEVAYWVDAKTGREIRDQKRIEALERRLRALGGQAE